MQVAGEPVALVARPPARAFSSRGAHQVEVARHQLRDAPHRERRRAASRSSSADRVPSPGPGAGRGRPRSSDHGDDPSAPSAAAHHRRRTRDVDDAWRCPAWPSARRPSAASAVSSPTSSAASASRGVGPAAQPSGPADPRRRRHVDGGEGDRRQHPDPAGDRVAARPAPSIERVEQEEQPDAGEQRHRTGPASVAVRPDAAAPGCHGAHRYVAAVRPAPCPCSSARRRRRRRWPARRRR